MKHQSRTNKTQSNFIYQIRKKTDKIIDNNKKQ